jgi:hypothetical protein
MGTAFTNPARRYKAFRPRQAVIGSRNTGTPTNLATVALFNNTSGPYWLVVRDATISGTASALVHAGYVQGQVWTASGVIQNMIITDAQLPGTIGSVDTATVFASAYLLTLPNGLWFWQHEMPWAVIAPGFSWVVQAVVVAQGIQASFIWEAIFPEELDFLYDSLPT